jgi:large subunit ribosomal protein L23
MAAKKKAEKVVLTPELADVIRGPVVTEKAALGSQYSQVTFKVAGTATKPQIKKAVEALFDVKVRAVNTLNTMGKTKRFKGIVGKRSDVKKAIVTLVEGQMIDTSSKV